MPCAAACAPRNRAAARKPPSADANGSRARRKCCSRSPARSPRRKWRGNPRVLLVGGRPDKFHIRQFPLAACNVSAGGRSLAPSKPSVLAFEGIGGEGETA